MYARTYCTAHTYIRLSVVFFLEVRHLLYTVTTRVGYILYEYLKMICICLYYQTVYTFILFLFFNDIYRYQFE